MQTDRKKELKDSYKAREVVGGICCTRCSGNGRVWIQTSRNIEGLKNRFNFAMKIKSAPDPSMREEWEKYGPESFSFSVLEEIKKSAEQTDREFADDIAALYEIWLEKSAQGAV